MKTFEKKLDELISEYSEIIDIYNSNNNCILEDDIQSLWNTLTLKNKKLKTTQFFKVISDLLDNYLDAQDIDIINYVSCIFDSSSNSHSLLQTYFNDVKLEYEKLTDDQLEYCEENRDAILKSNLKMVISIAKRYRNIGVSLEDLIGAGNVGLCTAWDKYHPEKNVLRDKVLRELEDCPEEINKYYIDSLLQPFIKYGSLKEKYDAVFSKNVVYKREDVIKWVTKNIKKAKFSSVAQLWIRASILQELNGNSRIVKKPKSEIVKDFEKYGSYLKEVTVPIDNSNTDDDKSNFQNKIELSETSNIEDEIDEKQNRLAFKKGLNELLEGVNNRDRRILFKCFGIGLPRAMKPVEVSEDEDLSIARVSQIIQNCISKMKKNAEKKNIKDLSKYLK